MILYTADVMAGATPLALAAAWVVRRAWGACVALCARAAAHRVLAPYTKWMFLSPTYVCLPPCHGSHTRNWEAKSADAALEGGRSHQAKMREDVAKLSAERMHRQLAVEFVLSVPASHRNLGSSLRKCFNCWTNGSKFQKKSQ